MCFKITTEQLTQVGETISRLIISPVYTVNIHLMTAAINLQHLMCYCVVFLFLFYYFSLYIPPCFTFLLYLFVCVIADCLCAAVTTEIPLWGSIKFILS